MSASPVAAEKHRLVHGDLREVCDTLAPSVSFDLVYLDPPFGLDVPMTARLAKGQARGRGRAGAGPEAYRDVGVDELLALLSPCLEAVRRRMTPVATLWLHLDHRAVHEVKVEADRVFGRGAFLGEVIWVPGNGGRGARGFSVTHQTLLLYAKSAADRRRVVYNAGDPMLRESYAPTSLSMHFKKRDADGRAFRERTLGGKTYRYYADVGRRLGSVWTDIPAMVANTPLLREGTGYPTQKPEKLLERIVRASSQPGAVVADLMCGSGTTALVAARLGRRFVAGDASPLAIEVASRRLAGAGVRFSPRARG